MPLKPPSALFKIQIYTSTYTTYSVLQSRETVPLQYRLYSIWKRRLYSVPSLLSDAPHPVLRSTEISWAIFNNSIAIFLSAMQLKVANHALTSFTRGQNTWQKVILDQEQDSDRNLYLGKIFSPIGIVLMDGKLFFHWKL
jgi:hypothetical protein